MEKDFLEEPFSFQGYFVQYSWFLISLQDFLVFIIYFSKLRPYFVQYDDVEVGEDDARAARTERTPFRRNLRRPTVPPPSVHMVRPVRNSFIFLY